MFSPEYEKRLLKNFSPSARRLFDVPESSSPSDRFIPCRFVIHYINLKISRWLIIFKMHRYNNNWETNFSTLARSNENSSQSKKQRECGESARDSLAYSCLLKNELLGASIDDIKSVSDDNSKMGYLQNSNRGLFRYQPPSKKASQVWLHFTDKKVNEGLFLMLATYFFVCIMAWI